VQRQAFQVDRERSSANDCKSEAKSPAELGACKLKDAGRFVYIEHKKGDPSYLPFIRPTLAKVEDALGWFSDDAELAWLRDKVAAWRKGA